MKSPMVSASMELPASSLSMTALVATADRSPWTLARSPSKMSRLPLVAWMLERAACIAESI